ncbi:MAG TPA: histone deacetylase family protein [Bacillota bacterium]|nr:histone deacetylase family protein [Bacillota bacterium]
MKIVYHDIFRHVYDYDPAAAAGRMEAIADELKELYEFVEPRPAEEDDLLLVHQKSHVDWVRTHYRHIYDIASLAAGGAIKAAELAVQGEPAFALIRPPGHHASPGSSWGFCWFNNVAVAVQKLRKNGIVDRVLIVDTDLHFGDGTDNIFKDVPEVFYYHLYSIDGLEKTLNYCRDRELVAVSAGFDSHKNDWGYLLTTEDFKKIGRMIAGHARNFCGGRFFTVLEGGYNHQVLGKNVRALLEGYDLG